MGLYLNATGEDRPSWIKAHYEDRDFEEAASDSDGDLARGSVDFFETYPGLYVPRPLMFRCDRTTQTPRALAIEIFALSKMNWNKTQFDGSDPISLWASRQVGSILKYVGE